MTVKKKRKPSPPVIEPPAGSVTVCRRCGGKDQRTGRSRAQEETSAGGAPENHSAQPVREVEFRCASCGASRWNPPVIDP